MVQNPKVYKATNTISDPSAFKGCTPHSRPLVVESIILLYILILYTKYHITSYYIILLHIDTIYQAYTKHIPSIYLVVFIPPICNLFVPSLVGIVLPSAPPVALPVDPTWAAIPSFRCATVGSLGDTAPGVTFGAVGDFGPTIFGDPGGKVMENLWKTYMENLWKTYGKPIWKTYMENLYGKPIWKHRWKTCGTSMEKPRENRSEIKWGKTDGKPMENRWKKHGRFSRCFSMDSRAWAFLCSFKARFCFSVSGAALPCLLFLGFE